MFLVSESYQADCCDLYKLNPVFLLPWSSVNTASLVKIIYSTQMRTSDKEPVFPNPLLPSFRLLICRPLATTCIQHSRLWWTACTAPNLLTGWPTKGRFCLLSGQRLTSTEGGCLTSRAQRECHGAGQNVNNKSPPVETESRSAKQRPQTNNLKQLRHAKRGWKFIHILKKKISHWFSSLAVCSIWFQLLASKTTWTQWSFVAFRWKVCRQNRWYKQKSRSKFPTLLTGATATGGAAFAGSFTSHCL